MQHHWDLSCDKLRTFLLLSETAREEPELDMI